jgi:formate C-acetyltransferase
VHLAGRYADEAQNMAAAEIDAARRAELEAVAEGCRRVPAQPPRTLHEALQAVWFTNSILMLEENQSGLSIGRIDQYVYPFFEADLAAGVLTYEQARELLGCFLLKFNENPWLLSEVGARYFAGYIPFQTMTLGGQTREGRDATNGLTLMLLDCVRDLQMYQPAAAARVHNASPQAYLERCVDVIETGCGFPALYFDDPTIRMMLAKGLDRDDALDYCIMGCVEPQVQGRMYQWTSVCYTNFPAAVEFALTNGRSRFLDEVVGVETGDPTTFTTFEEFEAAVKRQIDHITKVCAELTVIAMRAQRRFLPKPLMSSLVEGCVESGRDVLDGGALFNCGPGLVWVGVANYANSLAAVKRLVYDERRFTMAELAAALDADFAGFEDIRHACLGAPKYGNDDDYADFFAGDALEYAARLGESYTFANGGRMSIGTLSVSSNTPYGLVIGALPDGRRAGAPLSDGISPAQGTDRLGPTAVIRSVTKYPHDLMSIGVLHNMKLDPGIVSSPDGRQALISLIRTHGLLGGAQLQFNCTTQEKLLAAQRDPDGHRGMVVRVAGYSAFFVELSREVQDEIISRTPQTSWSSVRA